MKVNASRAGELAPLAGRLWPEHSPDALVRIVKAYAEGEESAVFALYREEVPVGIGLAALRHDYVEGCKTSPVGYLEGGYVEEACRRQGAAKLLVEEAMAWAKALGCSEFASDCELANTASLRFHLGVGFEEANRLICFRRRL